MAQTNPGFEVIEGGEAQRTQTSPPTAKVEKAALQLLMILLGTLSQRMVVALADLFTLLTVASAFWLWWSIPVPNDRQIIALSIYAVFVLAANWIVRGRK